MNKDRVVRVLTILGGISFLYVGAWAFFAPDSFYQNVATYPPYNEHFIHDVGAFNLGLAVALFLSLVRRDALFVVLVAAGVGSAFHSIAHFEDRSLGGNSSDPYVVGLLAVVLLLAAVLRVRTRE